MVLLQYQDDSQTDDIDDQQHQENENYCNWFDDDDGKITSYICAICDCYFSSKFALINHRWCQKPKTKYTSRNTHLTESRLNNDMSLQYSSKQQRCSDTNKLLDNENNNAFKCPICNTFVSDLKIHLGLHRPKGKYACEICGRM